MKRYLNNNNTVEYATENGSGILRLVSDTSVCCSSVGAIVKKGIKDLIDRIADNRDTLTGNMSNYSKIDIASDSY